MRVMALLFALVFLGLMPLNALAFKCPSEFAKAQAVIDRVSDQMKGMGGKAGMEQVHMLLDDAKMWLENARHNHEKPQGLYDHSRAVAKANAAYGYAVGAEELLKRL